MLEFHSPLYPTPPKMHNEHTVGNLLDAHLAAKRNMPERKTEVIERLKWADKYVEFWWIKGDDPERQYDECDRQERFHDAVAKAGLDEHVANFGYRGLAVVWEMKPPNWTIASVHRAAGLTAQQQFNLAWVGFQRDEDDGYPYYEAKPHKCLGDLQDIAARFYSAGFIDGSASETT